MRVFFSVNSHTSLYVKHMIYRHLRTGAEWTVAFRYVSNALGNQLSINSHSISFSTPHIPARSFLLPEGSAYPYYNNPFLTYLLWNPLMKKVLDLFTQLLRYSISEVCLHYNAAGGNGVNFKCGVESTEITVKSLFKIIVPVELLLPNPIESRVLHHVNISSTFLNVLCCCRL